MANLILPSRRVVQPQGPVEIDWANPLARGLLGLVAVVDGTPVELVQRKVLTRAGNAKVAAGKKGRAAVTSADGDYFTANLAPIPVTSLAGVSWFSWSRVFADEGGVRKRSVRWANSVNGTVLFAEYTIAGMSEAYLGGQSATGGFSQTKLENINIVEPHFFSANYSLVGGYQYPSLYLDGTSSAQVPGAAGDGLRDNIDQIWLGANTTNLSLRGEVYLAGLYGRQLSAAEHRELASNPWQLFRPIQRRVWVPGADLPVNVTLEAAAVQVATASASLNQSVPLAGVAVAGSLASGGLTLTVQLAASAVSSAVATAAAAVQKGLAGAGAAQAGGGAALQVTGSGATLGASAVAQAGGSASLALVLGLAAGALGRSSAAASLWVQVPLSAAALEQVSASASLTLVVNVQAAAVAGAMAGAALRADFKLQAAAQVVAVAGAVLTVTSLFASAPPGFGFYRPAQPVFRPRSVSGGRPSMINTRRR